MSGIAIVVEGRADKKFLQDFISHAFNKVIPNHDFVLIDGNITKINLVVPDIKSRMESGKTIIFILDADDGYGATITKIKNNLDEDILSEIFLFPNNESNGNLESLLRRIILSENEKVFACISNYAECIGKLRIDHLKLIDSKAEIFIYVDSFSVGGQGKETARDYQERRLWDLEHEALVPLKEFLRPFLLL